MDTATLAAALNHWVHETPGRAAFVDGNQVTSYGDLGIEVAAFRRRLTHAGFRAGDRVALLLPNSVAYAAAFYGTISLGGVAVPLNTRAPMTRLRHQVEHAGARWLVGMKSNRTARDLLSSTPEHPTLISPSPAPTPFSAGVEHPRMVQARLPIPTPESAACILYTSGTTGRPKGVTLSHRNLLFNNRAIATYLRLTQEDRGITLLPFYYSYGSSVLHSHLLVGASLLLETSLAYPHRVLRRVAEAKVTGLAGVAATFNLLMTRADLENTSLPSLRYVTQAGGRMAPTAIAQLRSSVPHADLWVMYGQTEGTARLAYLPPDQVDRKPESVGVALPGTRISIRREGAEVTNGELGEVCTAGDHVMIGYWRDTEATAAVIRNGWLHTGDLGYFDAEGHLYIEGRITDIIKAGAERIHPSVIEEVLTALPAVSDCAAFGVPDPLLGERVAAAVVFASGAIVTEREILAHCRRHLTIQETPGRIHVVQALPRTSSGKTQRHRLRELLHPGTEANPCA